MNNLTKVQIEYLDSLNWDKLYSKNLSYAATTSVFLYKASISEFWFENNNNYLNSIHLEFPDIKSEDIAVYLSIYQQKFYELNCNLYKELVNIRDERVAARTKKVMDELDALDRSNFNIYLQEASKFHIDSAAYVSEKILCRIWLSSEREDLLELVAFMLPLAILSPSNINYDILMYREKLQQVFILSKIKYMSDPLISGLIIQLEKKYNKEKKSK